MFNPTTQLNLVIGHPLMHSQSPLLHNMVYQALGCNAVLLACAYPNLSKTLETIKTLSVGYLAVTMPFKEEIVPYLDEMSPAVSQLQAANTVIVRDGKLEGYNTDVDGIAYALRKVSLANKNVLIIGAGGAARAMAYVAQAQQANLFWFNRTPERIVPLVAHFGGTCVTPAVLHEIPIDVIINTTPLGLFPEVDRTPLPDYIFRTEQAVFDMVYNPVETRLLQDAKAKGAVCISGLDMFIGQGLRQIELWLEKILEKEKLTELIKQTIKTEKTK
jgi:shikimate dehydrogenase